MLTLKRNFPSKNQSLRSYSECVCQSAWPVHLPNGPKKSWPQVVQFVPTVVTQLIPTDTPAPGPNCNVELRTAHCRAGTHRSYHHGLQCNILWEHRRYKRRL